MARRPRLLDAPRAVLRAVEDVLHAEVIAEHPADAGFTFAIASTVLDGSGRRTFVKAGPRGDAAGDGVLVGAQLAPVVDGLGPRLVGHAAPGEWAVAVYEFVDGAALRTWSRADVEAMAELSSVLRDRLDPSPVDDTGPYCTAFAPLLGTWQALASGDLDAAGSVEHVAHLPLPYDLDVHQLADLERQWCGELASGRALQHGDLRRDNVIRERSGRLWLVDWTHRWTAPGWVDIVRLAPDVALSGHDPEDFLRRSAWGDAPGHGVDVLLAGLAGRAWRDGHRPPDAELPALRRMQLRQAGAMLRWLSRRLATST